ncbi:acetyl-CoA hydrolase/transferase family protein [Deinococcus fonticola]|uniref:acetyl-CoA hydrolase/transferase family protein n=1 Tax=Deinococcus fonticola TaxID=2528713 RepID=UPI00197ABB0B|nr:acetyl-CoA hydrolase/transferase C-terminal domain-containing protein [Deinococcus fonticola]
MKAQKALNTMSESQIKALLESRRLPDDARVIMSGNQAVPWRLLHLLDETLPTYRLSGLNAPQGLPRRDGVTYETSFVGAGMRGSARLVYIPARLSMVPILFGTTRKPEVLLIHTSTPRNGKVSLGVEVNILPAAIEACRKGGGLIIAQMNRQMPYTFGDGEYDTDIFDAILEVDEPLPTPPARTGQAPDAAQSAMKIGERVSSRVQNGATMQLGIGEVPDAVLQGLTGLKNLGVWSEMFSDGVLSLLHAGALDPDRKIISSFAFGSEELYRWMDGNDQIRMLRTETTNAPTEISKQPGMTSVNTALQVDLFAQANASRINARIFSGFGGQTDFIVGALHAPGGQAIMALRSWHPKAQVSTIVPILREPTTSFQPTAVITEQGTAEILGYDEKRQAAMLIEHAAHPNAREFLWYEARKLGLT